MGGREEQKQNETDEFKVLERFKGAEMVGWEYEPLFKYFYDKMKGRGCFKIIADDFVSDQDGTGIVHCAPAFGADDYNVALQNNIIEPHDPCVSIDENGQFTDLVPDLKGKFIKDADPEIIKRISEMNRLVQKGTILHSYPTCWRSGDPLIYKAISSWYIKVSQIRDKLVKNNSKAYWVPKVI